MAGQQTCLYLLIPAVGSLSLSGFCLAAFWVCGTIRGLSLSCEDQQGEPEAGWFAELSPDPSAGL